MYVSDSGVSVRPKISHLCLCINFCLLQGQSEGLQCSFMGERLQGEQFQECPEFCMLDVRPRADA